MIREILVHAPDGTKRKVALAGQRMNLGRARENDLCFPEDASLSRRHLVLEREGDGWIVEDLGAKNTTLVNGAKLIGRYHLSPGDRIAAGQILLIYDEPGEDTSGSVVFYPGNEAPLLGGTVMTSLDGLLSRDTTLPGRKPRELRDLESDRQLSLDHRAVKALLRAGRELSGHRPVPELCQLILDLSIEAVGAERGVLMTLEGEKLVVGAVRGDGFRISATVRDHVLKDKNSLLVRDTQQDDQFKLQQSIIDQNIRTMMAVPLQTNDRVIGLIHVDSRFFVRDFTPADLDLLTVLANVAAIRIEQERLLQVELDDRLLARELLQAAEIQQRLLPSEAPKVSGVELAGHNAACKTVGGDYYDFFTYPDGRVAMVLGDVTGKGMPAALLMASVQATLRVLAEDADDLARLMSRLDRAMAACCPDNRSVTLFFCVLDPATGGMRYCNAGHNPPHLVRSNGQAERLKGGGTLLGPLPDFGYKEHRCRLEVGDVLTLFSDGVTEATDPKGVEFGEERLAELVAEHRTQPVELLIDLVNRAVQTWTEGAPPADDVTLVIARRVE